MGRDVGWTREDEIGVSDSRGEEQEEHQRGGGNIQVPN